MLDNLWKTLTAFTDYGIECLRQIILDSKT